MANSAVPSCPLGGPRLHAAGATEAAPSRVAHRRPARRRSSLAVASVLVALAAIVAVAGWQVYQGQRLPDGPVQVVWEKEACGHCHMHLSEMGYAVQLQTADGAVVNFDDPGCFFLYLADERPEVHEVWFHHSREDRWLRRDETGFVPAAATPMNFGLAAVARGEAGALSYDAARDRTVAHREGGR